MENPSLFGVPHSAGWEMGFSLFERKNVITNKNEEQLKMMVVMFDLHLQLTEKTKMADFTTSPSLVSLART